MVYVCLVFLGSSGLGVNVGVHQARGHYLLFRAQVNLPGLNRVLF